MPSKKKKRKRRKSSDKIGWTWKKVSLIGWRSSLSTICNSGIAGAKVSFTRTNLFIKATNFMSSPLKTKKMVWRSPNSTFPRFPKKVPHVIGGERARRR